MMAAAGTNGTEGGVAVWEWLNEFGRWRPYEPHVSQFIEQQINYNRTGAAATVSNSISLVHVDPALAPYDIDLTTMLQTRHNTGMQRSIRRCVYPPSSPAGLGAIWQWEGDQPGHWHSYDMDVACVLEEAQRKGVPQIDLRKESCGLPYIVDLQSSVQIRVDSGFQRNIRRYARPQNMLYSQTTDQPGTVLAKANLPTGSAHSSGSVLNGALSSMNSFGRTWPPIATATPNPGTSGFAAPSSSTFLQPATFQPPPSNPAPFGQSLNGGTPQVAAFQPVQSYVPMPGGAVASTSTGAPGKEMRKSGAYRRRRQCRHRASASTAAFTSTATAPPGTLPALNHDQTAAPPPGTLTPMVSSASTFPGMGFQSHRTMSGVFGSRVPIPPIAHSCSFPGTSNATQIGGSEKRSRMGSITNTGSSTNAEDALKNYVTVVTDKPTDDDCCICCEPLDQDSGYGGDNANIVEKLRKCSHMFHKPCIHAMYNSGTKDGSLQCPTCKTVNGVKYGNCPPGRMDFHSMSQSLPGYEGCGTISITYYISPGIQTAGHPNPGGSYNARGFPRQGFLPNNDEGNKVLQLLIKAWERRLTFTIGTSATTGESDTVVWNEIHHKTEFVDNQGHGYPDPKYLENVTMELAAQGVTDDDAGNTT